MGFNIFKQVSQLFSLRHALDEAGFVNIAITNIKREHKPDKLFFKCQMDIKNNIGIELKICEYFGTSITIYNESYKLTQKVVDVSSIDEIIQVIQILIEQFNANCNVLAPL